jgi:hypothetical protein
MARMQSHALEEASALEVYRCKTCQKWHLGNPIVVRRRFPVVDRELFHREIFHLELGGRATACMWDESYRPLQARAYHIRKRVRSAQRLAARFNKADWPWSSA